MNSMKQRIKDSWLVCCLTAATFFLVGPVALYLSNREEFSFYLVDILPLLILCFLGCFALLLLVCVLIKNEKIRLIVTACILGIGIGFFVQSNFLSDGYSQLNGVEMDWASMRGRGILNTVIWIACLAAPIFAGMKLKKNRFLFLKAVAVVLLLIQLISASLLAISAAKEDNEKDFVVSSEQAFTLSEEQNVVVFVLDNFSSTLFEDIITEEPEYLEKFSGFTYFPDNSGVGNNTKGSLPFLLTGVWNENRLEYNGYLDEAFADNPLYELLREKNFDCRVFTSDRYISDEHIDYFSNISYAKSSLPVSEVTKLMYKFTAFTYMPHFLKSFFWFYSGEFSTLTADQSQGILLSPDSSFYKSLCESGMTYSGDYDGAFRFYHLNGAHAPYTMNEDAEKADSGTVTAKQQAKGALKIVLDYLQDIKTSGHFDNTMVVVLADHGDWEDAEEVYNPLLLVKPMSALDEDLIISQAQVSTADVIPTIMEQVGGEEYGTSVFDVAEDEVRERRFMGFNWDGNWEANYLPDIYEHSIVGNVRDPESRTLTGNVYTGNGVVVTDEQYTLGQILEYNSLKRNVLDRVSYGLYYPEETHTWTRGNYTEWVFPMANYEGGNLVFSLDLVAVKNESQRVRFIVNGEFLEEKTTTGGKLEFTIPEDMITSNTVEIRLEYPDASSGDPDSRIIALAIRSAVLNTPGGDTFYRTIEYEKTIGDDKSSSGFSITEVIGIPLAALLRLCYRFLHHYSLAIILFTLLTKVILFPVSLWVQKNGIAMVRLTPELNRLKIKYYGDKDTIAEETQVLYKREHYHPLASTIPMVVQLVLLIGVIGAVKQVLGGADSILTEIPSQTGGWTYLMPIMAGAAALALGLAQNHLNPLQREQSKKEQWMTNGLSIAISLFLGLFVSLGVCIYWICSNLFSILQQLLLNLVLRPAKYIDYEELEQSKKELAGIDSLSAHVSKEDKKREKTDYKRFFSVANKHLVFYSEKSGFYKYFKDVIEYLLKRSNVIVHYVTSDPNDQIFEIAKTQPRIRPYYIGENRLITLMMKMDADIVVMTVPDLENYHLKRSYVRKDIEYIYMFHYPLSTHMVLHTGALDHYDTIFCVGEFQFDEIRAAERVYALPEKKLISVGYGQLEQLYASYKAMLPEKRERPKILIAPSWQADNILDSCIDGILAQLLDKGFDVVVRPHPEYMKRYKPRMDQIVERYKGRESSGLRFELDFTSNNSIFDSDALITDWSGTAYEFSFVTLKPSVFIDTPAKINNPDYVKLGIEPLEFSLRSQVGIRVSPDALEGLDEKIGELLKNGRAYEEKILEIREKYIANFGKSGEVGGKYIISQLISRQNERAGRETASSTAN